MTIINDNNFKHLITPAIESADSPNYILVDFWGENCTPCNRLAEILELISKEFQDKLRIYKMNVNDNPVIPSEFRIRAIPTLVLFKDGKEFARNAGFVSKETLLKWLDDKMN